MYYKFIDTGYEPDTKLIFILSIVVRLKHGTAFWNNADKIALLKAFPTMRPKYELHTSSKNTFFLVI